MIGRRCTRWQPQFLKRTLAVTAARSHQLVFILPKPRIVVPCRGDNFYRAISLGKVFEGIGREVEKWRGVESVPYYGSGVRTLRVRSIRIRRRRLR